jgi:hypothetical protein
MIEAALLLGLGALGYVLAAQQQPSPERFSMPTPQLMRSEPQTYVPESDETDPTKGHSNEVPFFGPRVTQSMYSGATNGILDTHTGAGKEYFQKREVQSLFDAKTGTQNPFGAAVETDFMQSRMVTGQRMNNVFPVEPVRVGPGVNDGYTNIPKGGYQQDNMREYAMPKTTDEVRVVGKEKLSHEQPVIPGVSSITMPGIQADVKKNKPDRFAVYGMDRANTAVGVQTAPRIYADQPVKTQARESTYKVQTTPASAGVGTFASYIRAFTEPYQEFMRLTAAGRPGPAGMSGTGTSVGAEQYSVQNKFDMDSVLVSATRLNVPQQVVTTGSQQIGSYRYNEPLQQDVLVQRNETGILDAFKQNPYTQKLSSY